MGDFPDSVQDFLRFKCFLVGIDIDAGLKLLDIRMFIGSE